MPNYDYPFNERIRVFLRLEDVFIKMQHFAAGNDEFDHHTTLLNMFSILDIVDRAELKTELLQELNRQEANMDALRDNPHIAKDVLEEVIVEIDKTVTNLRKVDGRIGQPLRDSEWLMLVKQRSAIPGGACEFDLPSLHYWLGLPPATRRRDIDNWINPLMPLNDALRIILHILRGSGVSNSHLASKGTFQQMTNGVKQAQMLRITLPDDAACFPEVSANKYALNIRFNCLEGMQKPQTYEQDVMFDLALCYL